jgi:metal-responsive CopG/Arc/MetJ family transcriptional regulator
MDTVRINISLPKDVYHEMTKRVAPRQRSRFIREAIKKVLNEEKAGRLASEYREAASEIKRINSELEGTISDGID